MNIFDLAWVELTLDDTMGFGLVLVEELTEQKHSSDPPLPKGGGWSFPKLTERGGFENFCRKGVES